MQLINKITGCIAKLDRWDLSNCKVDLFENGILQDKGIISERLTYKLNLNLEVPVDNALQSVKAEIIKLIYEQLLTYPEFENFEISTEEGNWLFSARNIRVSLDRQLALEAIYENNSLGQLFDVMRVTLKDFIISNAKTMTIYLEELYSQHQMILEQYPEHIFIENRTA
jgi:hypothetical protein